MNRLRNWWAARRYERGVERAHRRWQASDAYARQRACQHGNREPLLTRSTLGHAERCTDCGLHIVTISTKGD